MITNLKIENFKSISNSDFSLKPLTILVGKNSTGKSSVIQSILLLCQRCVNSNHYSMQEIVNPFSNFQHVRNRYLNSKKISIAMKYAQQLDDSDNKIDLSFTDIQGVVASSLTTDTQILKYESQQDTGSEILYLNANRIGQESIANYSDSKNVGTNGEFLFSSFERKKSEPLDKLLCIDDVSETLSYQLNYWLSIITDIKSSLKTERVGVANVKVTFDSGDLNDIEPLNLGAGFSYLAKVLILCLMAKKNDVVIIENPEIHLHPKSQSMLGVFFSFIANAGIQLIIETHCEHFISKLRYQIYDEQFKANSIVIYYKEAIREPFIKIELNDDGNFINDNNDVTAFPKDFFDTSNADLLAMR